jgi:hypothetical protein
VNVILTLQSAFQRASIPNLSFGDWPAALKTTI